MRMLMDATVHGNHAASTGNRATHMLELHRCVMDVETIAKHVTTEEERAEWDRQFEEKWSALALDGFNGDDIWARLELQKYYVNDTAWVDEQLAEPDVMVVRWRQLAHRHNRGVQRQEHLR